MTTWPKFYFLIIGVPLIFLFMVWVLIQVKAGKLTLQPGDLPMHSCDYDCRSAGRLDYVRHADHLVKADFCWLKEPGVIPHYDPECMRLVMGQYDYCWLNADNGKTECELHGKTYPL
jgi:hypothetical protein